MWRVAVAILSAVLGAGGCGGPAVTGPTLGLGDVTADERQDLFERLCASCHGLDGRGDGPVAGQLVTRPPDLTALARRHDGVFPREDVVRVLSGEQRVPAHGTRVMPVWGQRLAPAGSVAVTAAQLEQARMITALTDYVASLQH